VTAFHLAWIAFFVSFCSTFMAAPLMPIIRDDLDMTATQVGNANSASVAGTVFFRILMGALCDWVGPRKAYGLLMILVSFPCFAMTMVTSYPQFVVCRCAIGFSLASFVSTQYWTTAMFTPKIVGGANAITAGWGNLGGGVTQIVTVIMFQYFTTYGPYTRSWRQCYFAPGLLHLLLGCLILFYGQDGPDGNREDVPQGNTGKAGVDKAAAWRNFKFGCLNYRTWIFTITYGFCFGVELVVDNILAGYFYSQFNLTLIDAGRIASYSGLMNVCSRATGGFVSDVVARRFGMRGRLWWLWFVQTAAGGVCLAFGYETTNVGNATATMVIFSFLCHAACGATFGVVPFISKRSVGTVSGWVGGGGNTIAAILQWLLFTNTQVIVPVAIQHLGIAIMCFTSLIMFCHFPMWGSMFLGPTQVVADVSLAEVAFYTREYTAEEKEQGLDMPAKLFAANAAISERSKHGSSAAMAEMVAAHEVKA
jgi:MFS transporter, NNP family, nitrate/nitrite transporter